MLAIDQQCGNSYVQITLVPFMPSVSLPNKVTGANSRPARRW